MLRTLLITLCIISFSSLTQAATGSVNNQEMIQTVLAGATANERAYIENKLENLNDLTVADREALRRLILDIYIRELKEIESHKKQIRELKSRIELDRYRAQARQVPPDIIKEDRQLSDEVLRATNQPLDKIEHVTESIEIDLNAKNPIEVPIAHGMGGTLIFIDRMGNPFPIHRVSDFTGKNFELVYEDVVANNNVMNVANKVVYKNANTSVFLAGQTLPVMLVFKSTKNVNSTRLIIRTKQISPTTDISNSSAPTPDGLPKTLYQIADYNVPANAEPMSMSHEAGDAWVIGESMYIRTPHRLLSPFTPHRLESNITGMENIYKLPINQFVVLIIDDHNVQVSITKPQYNLDKLTGE